MDLTSILTVVGVVVPAVFGSQVLVAKIQAKASAKTEAAKADSVTTDNALKFAEATSKRVDKLEDRMEKMQADYENKLEQLRKENLELHKEVAGLRVELAIYKSSPVLTPSLPPPPTA